MVRVDGDEDGEAQATTCEVGVGCVCDGKNSVAHQGEVRQTTSRFKRRRRWRMNLS